MSENTDNNRNVRNDEIDLLDLFNRIGRAINRLFRALGKGLLISIVFLLRRWLPITISLVLGIVVAFIMWNQSGSYYSSDLTLKVNIKSTDEVIAYVNRLNTLCSRNPDQLATKLGITSSQAKNIREILAFWVIDQGNDSIPDYVDYAGTHDLYDTINVRMFDRLNVRVKTNEIQQLNDIRNGLLKYIASEPSFIQKNALRLRQANEMLTRYDTDIQQLDSLQRLKYFEEPRNLLPRTNGQTVFLQEQRTQLFYSDIYKLYRLKQNLERDIDLYKDIVTIINDFSLPIVRENGLVYYLKIFVPIILTASLIILIIIANYSSISVILKKY